MKRLLILVLSFIVINSYAQDKPVLENDTISYAGKKFWVGQEVTLGYGSGNNKQFVFVFMGSGMTGVDPVEATFAKTTFKVDKVYKQNGKFLIRGRFIDTPGMISKMFADIERAVDNKEL